ncbi:MAG: DUF3299 domain-containing protein [Burkholderiaceae bacterium]
MKPFPRRFFQVLVLIVSFGVFASVGLANKQSNEITWEALVPPQSESLTKDIETLQAALDDLDETKRSLFYEIDDQVWLKRRIELKFIDAESLTAAEKTRLETDYEKERPELFALWERVQEVRAEAEAAADKINGSLDGQTVRMPGYLLPLETEGVAVREFLLVPYVGACIHVPPPPANQMVYVKLDQPYQTGALFEPVWVEGVLSTEKGTHELSLVDGSSDVNTGYSMRADSVTKHTK